MVKLYNLTNPQKSIWNMEKFFECTNINNICASITILDQLDTDLLKKAIYNTVVKNDSFRIKIVIKNNVPMQYISEFNPFQIEIFNLENNTELEEIKEKLINYKFNILDSNLFCFKIVKFEDGHGMLIFTVHHIIADSWSLGLFAQNLMQEYNKLKNHEELFDNKNSYVEYINSENTYKQNKKYETDKEYWEKMFQIIPEQVTFPSQKKITNTVSYNSKRESFKIDSNFTEKIKTFCNKNKISVFNFFMAIYSIYLSKTSGLDEFVIGTPILNRTNFKEKQIMGMFINTIPIKISLNWNNTFSEFTKTLNSNILSDLKHQKYSYSQILEDLRNKNSTNILSSALYNVVISYQITKAFNKECGNYTTEWYSNNYSSNDCNIHITDINDTGELIIHYDYLCYKYEKNDIIELHKRIKCIIDQIFKNEQILLNDINILSDNEKYKILNEFNNSVVEYKDDISIVDMFEKQVQKTPYNIAVEFGNKKLTYNELNQKANSLANYLKLNFDIKNGSIIPVIMNRSIDLIISMLAIIKLNCVYLPISLDTPPQRINYILEDSNAELAIINNKQNYNIKTINIEEVDYSISNNIYIIYTSGSTGKPKGVKICHKNLKNFVYSFNKLYGGISEKDKLLASTNISFDVSIFEIFMPLLYGATLYLYDEPTITDIFKYCKIINENKITFLYIPPNILDLVYNILSKSENTSINKILLGVEPIRNSIVKKFYNLNPNLKIINAYGPTETTICATAILLDKNIIENYKIIPIGKPLPNLKIFILDKNLQPVPIGVEGEIYISGNNVSNGYLNNEELTNKSFIKLPNLNCEIAYKTGDLGKWDDNGIINFIGRNDNQIKINGHRIELGEIEACIYSYQNITKVVVISKNNKIICYFTSNKQIDINDLKNYTKNKLPTYFIPNFFMQVSEFELTQNGKIDKNKLPEIIIEQKKSKIIEPRNNTDIKLINILKDILNINSISIDDSFLDLGGDSLSAINLCVAIQTEFETKIFVKDILENPKIMDISEMISNAKLTSFKNKSLEKIHKNNFYHVSSAQKRMYISSKLTGENSIVYNIPGGLIFDRKPDLDKIKNCFKTLIQRHEIFRTYFEMIDNNIVQKILDNVDFNLDTLENADFSNIEIIFKNFVKPFDLSKAPLLRAKFIEFTNKKYALFIDMHHIISDGASLQIFTDEFCKLYNNEQLQEIKFTYKDYSAFENTRINSDEYKEAEKYWLSQFKDEIPVLNMPTNYQRPTIQDFTGSRVCSVLPSNTLKKLEELSNSLNSTQYMILLSAYYVLLSKYTFRR